MKRLPSKVHEEEAVNVCEEVRRMLFSGNAAGDALNVVQTAGAGYRYRSGRLRRRRWRRDDSWYPADPYEDRRLRSVCH